MQFDSQFAAKLAGSLILSMATTLLSAQAPAPASSNNPEIVKVLGLSGSFLGVGVQEVNSERSKALKLKEEFGVEITRVEDNSPASRAGLKVHDVVLEYNGQRVEGTEQFIRFVRETPAGRTIKLTLARGGVNQTVAATIGARKPTVSGVMPMESFRVEFPREMSMPDIPKAMMSWRSSVLGVEAESLGESQLAAYFGVKEGVLVRSVMKSTAAEKAGIKAGDVLIKVNDTRVTSPRDVTNAIRAARANSRDSYLVVLMREKKEMTLTVSMDDESSDRTPPRGQAISVR
ncbi:PDZ domain-containing protein [uncultured Paludibaculum sp.]|uniref:PDZ domain-containing protein n=1 Tax=uncultured Paludibaculum sp. TaxID=1765020 RepID=UPI002AAB51ED|nr:PDZ domain-containing protein [uncultured Paludibaculum sp.]